MSLYQLLHEFSEKTHNELLSCELWSQLEKNRIDLNFPAVKNDVGKILNLIVNLYKPKKIFEFGSGYGHSAFWYLWQQKFKPEKIILTERRDDLFEKFNQLSWHIDDRNRLEYFQGNAEFILDDHLDSDLFFIDGEKALYHKWVKILAEKMKTDSMIIIDNSFWKGSFLEDQALQTKRSIEGIKSLHQEMDQFWDHTFIPVSDGLSILRKLN